MRSTGSILRLCFAVVVALAATPGCFAATFVDARFAPQETHDVWVHGYLFGLIGTTGVDARYVCASDAVGVDVHESAVTWTLTVITLGVYTPRVAAITCSRGSVRESSR
jgi:hypothetical protein